MKLSYLGIAGFAAAALAFTLPAFASTAFTVTGIVDVQLTKSVVNITASKASSGVSDETFNKNIPYTVSKSTVYYKYVKDKNNKPVLVKTSLSAVRLGQEVVVKGVKSSDTYKVSSLTINDQSFLITGTVSNVNKKNSEITVSVKTSTYKNKTLKGTDITTTYTSKTVCKQDGKEIGCSEIDSDSQKITVEGGITGTGNTYELLKVTNKK